MRKFVLKNKAAYIFLGIFLLAVIGGLVYASKKLVAMKRMYGVEAELEKEVKLREGKEKLETSQVKEAEDTGPSIDLASSLAFRLKKIQKEKEAKEKEKEKARLKELQVKVKKRPTQKIIEPEEEEQVIEKPEVTRNYNTQMIVFDNTTRFKSKKTVPIGTMFDVYLITNIISNNFSSPVVCGVIEPLVYNRELILPVGSRIIGSASAGRQRDRCFTQFHTAVFPDGSTVPLGGIGMMGDGSAGLKGYLVDKKGLKMLMAFAADFLAGFTMMMTDTYINPVTGNQEISTNTKNAFWGGVANSFQKISEDIRTAANRDDAYLVIAAGTSVKIYLTKTVDFEKKGG